MAKTRKKTDVPKRIAGAKVPKPLRRGLKRLAKSPEGKAAVVEALLVAGAALVAQQMRPGSKARRAAAKVGKAANGAAAKGKAAKGKVATSEAAAAFRDGALASAFGSAIAAFTETLRSHAPAQPATAETPDGAGPTH